MIEWFVPGAIASQGSKRFMGMSGGKGIMLDADPKLKHWRATIHASCPLTAPLTGPVALDLTFYFPRPKSHYGRRLGAPYLKDDAPVYKSNKPDADKIARAALDALTCVAYVDDAQVAQLSIVKLYADVDARLGVHIAISSC